MSPVRTPPESPEGNPSEHLGNAVRDKAFAQQTFPSLTAVADTLCHALRRLETTPDRVRSIAGFPWVISHS